MAKEVALLNNTLLTSFLGPFPWRGKGKGPRTTLHTAAEPAVRSAVKILVSQRNDTIKAFFFATNKNKNSAQVPLDSTSS